MNITMEGRLGTWTNPKQRCDSTVTKEVKIYSSNCNQKENSSFFSETINTNTNINLEHYM